MEEDELLSEGKCVFCDQLLLQDDIAQHLATHLATMQKDDKGNCPTAYCHIEVEAAEMFLHLLVKAEIAMSELDFYLRNIWLDCCGHMSEFGHKNIEIEMEDAVGDVFQPKVKIYLDYDFGDTTRIFLRGIKNYSLALKEEIVLLSRNEPLKLLCDKCKRQPAADICIVCDYTYFCPKCAEKHEKECEDFADYSKMPVVNSPRMGVCGYMGGHIDTERDGIYKKKKTTK